MCSKDGQPTAGSKTVGSAQEAMPCVLACSFLLQRGLMISLAALQLTS